MVLFDVELKFFENCLGLESVKRKIAAELEKIKHFNNFCNEKQIKKFKSNSVYQTNSP